MCGSSTGMWLRSSSGPYTQAAKKVQDTPQTIKINTGIITAGMANNLLPEKPVEIDCAS